MRKKIVAAGVAGLAGVALIGAGAAAVAGHASEPQQAAGVNWEDYPGLKARIDFMVQWKSCDLLQAELDKQWDRTVDEIVAGLKGESLPPNDGVLSYISDAQLWAGCPS